MIPEAVFYLFLFPWIAIIAAIPGLAIKFLVGGIVAQLLNYLPGSDSTPDQ